MLGAFLSPLAPAAILLLSAFILSVALPVLPAHWRSHPWVQTWTAPALVGLALTSLLGVRLTPVGETAGTGLDLLSGWNFSTTESVAALTVRADLVSLPFLLVVLLVLLMVTLLRAGSPATTLRHGYWLQMTGWLGMAAGACLLFVAGNGLTLVYTVMVLDAFTAFYWLGRGAYNLTVARLFLGVFTGAAVMLATLTPAVGWVSGLFLLGVALWLRLGLYPFIEAGSHFFWHSDERLAYQGISMAGGIYLVIRLVSQPLPDLIYGVGVVTMLLAGLLTWLSGLNQPLSSDPDAGAVVPGVDDRPTTLLTWLFITEALLFLLDGSLETGEALAFAVGLILSLVALWVTPALGPPRLEEGAWSWPYLPAAAATLTLVGVPFSLGWPARLAVYSSLFQSGSLLTGAAVILAEGLAFSGLIAYWVRLTQGDERNDRRSMVSIVAMTPFLTPGLAPLFLSALTGVDLELTADSASSGVVLAGLVGVALLGVGLAYFREPLINRLKLPPSSLAALARLAWLVEGGESLLNHLSKLVLRLQVVLEGRHYLGWAIFVAIVGALIFILN